MRNKIGVAQIRAALNAEDIPHVSVDVQPFVPDMPVVQQEGPLICWGPSFVPRVLEHADINPGIWYDHDTFRWSVFQNRWGSQMLNQSAEVMPFDVACEQLSNTPQFLRPDANNKAFEGGVFDANSKPKLQPNFDPKIPTVVAPPTKVTDEWRFFVVNGQIADASSYRVSGQPNQDGFVPADAVDLVFKAIESWTPAPVVCIDVGFDGQRFGIVEANCFNASRLYGANPQKIVFAVTEFVRKDFA
ncbi:MAG: ATP-grasp domain-containing protein [Planktomarina sp.]